MGHDCDIVYIKVVVVNTPLVVFLGGKFSAKNVQL
jgi:hypothetical protein